MLLAMNDFFDTIDEQRVIGPARQPAGRWPFDPPF